jgi:hypothetical protein
MLATMRRASSRVRRCAAERRPRLLLEIHVGERLPAVIADDEAGSVKEVKDRYRKATLP